MRSPQRPADASITSPRSDRVRKIAALTGRSARRRHGLLRVEGPQAVRSLLSHRSDAAAELFLTEAAATAHPELEHLAARSGVPVRSILPEVLEAMVRDAGDLGESGGAVSPQGVVATASLLALETTLEDTLAALDPTSPVSVLVLHELRDPGNVGTLLRTADASGADLVILTAGSVDIHGPKVVRSSAGSLFHLPIVAGVDPRGLLPALRAAGIQLAATSGGAPHELYDIDLPRRIAWVMGNEAHGLPGSLLEEADLAVRIPLAGHAESLNVAVAATVCLYETLRRRRAAGSPAGDPA